MCIIQHYDLETDYTDLVMGLKKGIYLHSRDFILSAFQQVFICPCYNFRASCHSICLLVHLRDRSWGFLHHLLIDERGGDKFEPMTFVEGPLLYNGDTKLSLRKGRISFMHSLTIEWTPCVAPV